MRWLIFLYLQKIDTSIRKEVDEASERAKTDPELPLEEMYNSVYIDPPSNLKIRGCDSTLHATTK